MVCLIRIQDETRQNDIKYISARLSILYFVNRKLGKLHGRCVDHIMLGPGLGRTTLYPVSPGQSISMWNFQFKFIIPFRFPDYIKLLSSRGKIMEMPKGSRPEDQLNGMSCCYTHSSAYYSARARHIVAGHINSLLRISCEFSQLVLRLVDHKTTYSCYSLVLLAIN